LCRSNVTIIQEHPALTQMSEVEVAALREQLDLKSMSILSGLSGLSRFFLTLLLILSHERSEQMS
jgi:hypothetical protein